MAQLLDPDDFYYPSKPDPSGRLPIDWLIDALEIPVEIARAFVGTTEKQTMTNIEQLKSLIDSGESGQAHVLILTRPDQAAARFEYTRWLTSIGGPDELRRRKGTIILPRRRDQDAEYGPHRVQIRGKWYWHNISSHIRCWRDKAGEKSSDLARAVGCRHSCVCGCISRGTGLETEIVKRIAAHYGITVTQLLEIPE